MIPSIARSGVAYLCGESKLGFPIVYFPSNCSLYKAQEVPVEAIYDLLIYYSCVADEIHGCEKLVILADFRNTIEEMKHLIIEAAESLHSNSDLLFHMYILEHNSNSSKLKMQLPMLVKTRRQKPPKSPPNIPFTWISDDAHLLQVVDEDQLSVDLQGRLPYNHSSWIHIRTVIDSLKKTVRSIELLSPELLDELKKKRLEKLPNNINTYLAMMSARYTEKRDSMGLDSALAQSCQLINVFVCPYSDPLFSEMEDQPVFKHARALSVDMMQRINHINRQITLEWNAFKVYVKEVLDFTTFEEKVEQAMMKVHELELKISPSKLSEVGNSFVQCESSMYKNIIDSMTDTYSIIKQVMQLNESSVAKKKILHCIDVTVPRAVTLSEICKKNFGKLNEKFPTEELMMGDYVYDCFSLYCKAFEFYHCVLNSLHISSNLEGELFLPSVVESQNSINLKDLISLRNKLDQIENPEFRNQARLLVYRCAVLLQFNNKVIKSTDTIMQSLREWKKHLDCHS